LAAHALQHSRNRAQHAVRGQSACARGSRGWEGGVGRRGAQSCSTPYAAMAGKGGGGMGTPVRARARGGVQRLRTSRKHHGMHTWSMHTRRHKQP
jgi:hypothetical protein